MRHRRINRATAEQLLAGDPLADHILGRLLSDVTAPAGRDELAGEEAAIAMWRIAGCHVAEPAPPRRHWRTPLAAMKIIAAGVVLGAGGVALAASAGVLHGSPHPTRPTVGHGHIGATGQSVTPPAISPTTGSGSRLGHDPGSTPTASGPDSGAHLTPAGWAELMGLCHAYPAAIAAGHANALDKPSYRPLVTAAGGRDRVSAFCATLTGSTPDPSPTPKPGDAAPTPAPDAAATTLDPGSGHGNGTPVSRPIGHPSQ
jgi:hypothetical protein